MDGSRFDDFTRTVATSRRNALRLVLGASVAALLPVERGEGASFGGGPFKRVGKRCNHGQTCGFLVPCQNGICTPSVCLIDNHIYQGAEPNPENPCQFCIPTVDGWRTWLGTVADGEACHFDDETLCQSADGVCQNAECVRTPLPDTSECGIDGICCSGACCEDGNCCCIDGQTITDGTLDPGSDCRACNPDQSISDWTELGDGAACGGVPGRVCCNGDCCSPTECCNGISCEECGPHCVIGGIEIDAETPNPQNECEICDPARAVDVWSPAVDGGSCDNDDGCCVSGACGVCSCTIDGEPVPDRTDNPRNDCQECIYARDPNNWSNRPNNSACGNGDRDCCDGECCPAGSCCTVDGCEPCCHIGSDTVADGVVNPQNTCQVCDSSRNSSDWTTLGNGDECGATGNSECCNGECCPTGQCCQNGACGRCDCVIGGVRFDPDEINRSNSCEICTPELNRFVWSPVASGTSCGSDGETCCGGTCCSPDLCCLLDACGECLCSIENQIVEPQDRNPQNTCQFCDPHADPFDWSTVPDRGSCGASGAQQCCNGFCCDPGQCCLGGACRPCGCFIDGQEVDPNRVNPANECQICLPDQSTDSWSFLADGGLCGDTAAQCCQAGNCEVCGCLIGGEGFIDGEQNPQNECQHCDHALDPSGWSPRNETFSCDTGGDGVCCNGICCPSGFVCNLDDTCTPPGCLIDGQQVAANSHNPLNDCQVCFPDESETDWSVLGDGAPCGDTGAQCCASGICQNCGCLIDGFPRSDGEPNPANACQQCDAALDPSNWSNRGETFSCGDAGDGICCAGVCCPAGNSCSLDDICTPPGCIIDGQDVRSGALNPTNECQFCDPDTATDVWTPLADGGLCGETTAQCCQAGNCEICGCLIGGEGFIDGETNPDNECQQCDHALDPGNWSPRNETFGCGPGGDQICCNGACCPADNCCNLDDICEPCRCEIEGIPVEAQTFSPDNHCLFCDPASSTTAWTFGPDYSVCSDPTAEINRYCCQGICCEEHECCRSDGTCGPCTCVIEGAGEFEEGDRNPANDCQICNPTVDRTGWQTLPDDTICGPNLDQTCCSGQCGCPTGCFIEGVNYEDGTIRPRERCDICDAANDPTDWTPRFIPDCPPPCTIGGVIMRYGTIKPDNPCQICRGGDDWSPSTELFCGDGTQVCCNGACCEVGACCSAEGVCGFDNCEQQGCVIDGVQFEDGTENPENACQICDISQSTSAWTPQFGQCGPNFDRFCCDGVCCDLGACCNNEQVCDFDFCQTCAIDGVLYFPEDLNPANSCEWCISNTNKFAWTTKPDNFFCDEMQLTVCCNASCCNPGESCIGGGCQPN